MAPTLSAQLGLGPLPRPSLRAEPGLVISFGKPVTLWCEGPPGAEQYRLRKERGSDLDMEKSVDGRRAQDSISYMTASKAGKYQCRYLNQSLWSELSDPLELIMAGSYDTPSLSAWPSSLVASGHNVTLQCRSQLRYDKSALVKEGEQIIHWGGENNGRGAQTNFSLLAVTPAHGGTYRCHSFESNKPYVWTAPSDPLVLRVTGPLPRPSLRAEPGLVIPWNKRVTLWCEGPPGADGYRLWKEGGSDLDMEKSADGRGARVISYLTEETAGRYQCRYMNQSLWSEPSDPLELRVTRSYWAPSLSAWPSSQVASGQEVTLQCQSQTRYDKSALVKDGEEITYGGTLVHGWGAQTNFSLPAVTPAHGGTYRCHHFDSKKPYVWSAPSDPLELRVTAAVGLSRLHVGILVGTSAFVLLLFLFLLLFYCRCWRHRSRLKKEGREADAKRSTRSSDPDGTPLEEPPYAHVGEDRQTEEAGAEDWAAPPGEDPQEVTYALLNLNSLKVRAEVPPPSGTEDASLYAALR